MNTMTYHPTDILIKVLQKPEPTRKIIATIVTIFLATLIIGVWWMTFSLKPVGTLPVAGETQNFAEASPFTIIWNSIKNIAHSNPIFK